METKNLWLNHILKQPPGIGGKVTAAAIDFANHVVRGVGESIFTGAACSGKKGIPQTGFLRWS